MAENLDGIRIGSCEVTLDGVNLGFTGEDTTVTPELNLAEITVDKYGSTPVDDRVIGRSVTVSMTLKQSGETDIADVWGNVFKVNDAQSAGRLDLSAETNDSLRAASGRLVLTRRTGSNKDNERFIFHKATVFENGDIELNNEGQTVLPATFKAYIDETLGLWTYGDSTE